MTEDTAYEPVQDGIQKAVRAVRYGEVAPPPGLVGLVHCFWELRTLETLSEAFHLHAVPDACVDIMFDQVDTSIAGITALHTRPVVLDLGRSFHYVGVQLLPGVWRGRRSDIADHFIGTAYAGDLPLIEANAAMAGLDSEGKRSIMADLVRRLADERTVAANPVTARILAHIDDIHCVADMARIVGVSARQLQRTLKRTTGFSPHDFLKVVRLQRSFTQGYVALYADQSHFIRSFRRMTGYTPARYFDTFDV